MILVVDDDNVTAHVWAYLFRQLRRQTVVATSGAEALRVLDTQPIEAIVCAIVLPDMDGLSFIARVRGRRHVADLPIVVCTGQTDAATVQRALTFGVVDFLVKPIRADHFPRVQRVLQSIPPRWESRHDVVRRLRVSTPEVTRLVALAHRDLAGVRTLVSRHLAEAEHAAQRAGNPPDAGTASADRAPAGEAGAAEAGVAELAAVVGVAVRRVRDAAATVGARRCAEVLGRFLCLPLDVSAEGLRNLRDALAVEVADFEAAFPQKSLLADAPAADVRPADAGAAGQAAAAAERRGGATRPVEAALGA